MKVELTVDEAWTLLAVVVDHVVDEAGLSDDDRARIKRWRSEEMKLNSEAMRVLAQKVNEDLEKTSRSKERSPIRRPDWAG
jgi:hypothetical protein